MNEGRKAKEGVQVKECKEGRKEGREVKEGRKAGRKDPGKGAEDADDKEQLVDEMLALPR